jgi:hypothetical protein
VLLDHGIEFGADSMLHANHLLTLDRDHYVRCRTSQADFDEIDMNPISSRVKY